jgi:hypothetical protein
MYNFITKYHTNIFAVQMNIKHKLHVCIHKTHMHIKRSLSAKSSTIFTVQKNQQQPTASLSSLLLATNRKVAGSIPDEEIFQICLNLPGALGPGVYSASNRNEYRKHKNNNVSGE